MAIDKIRAPFTYFGGKSRIAETVWKAFGKIGNYVEPFAGSLAVLLANSSIPKIETVNDINCFIANFWRATSFDHEKVVEFSDSPVNETDIHAKLNWLLSSATDQFKERMNSDPHFYDCKIAGYWVQGMSASVGNNWMNSKGLKALPLLSSAGGGVNGLKFDYEKDFKILKERLKKVRVACGDWKRIVTPSITYENKGLGNKDFVGVFLDPPYDLSNRDKVYQEESNLFQEVCDWAIANGDNERMRIAVCGYDGEYGFPESWRKFSWKANGGMANLGNDRGKENAKKETIWFSPHCLPHEN